MLALVAYAAAIGVGAWFIVKRNLSTQPWTGCVTDLLFVPPCDYVAARHLPAHHRLTSEDLALPPDLPSGRAIALPDERSLVGLYVASNVDAGEPIEVAQLAAHPRPSPSEGKTAVPIALGDDALAKTLDVGWIVDLCGEDQCVVREATVLALDHLGTEQRTCFAILELSPEQCKALNDAGNPGLRVVVRRPRLEGY